MEPKWLDIYPAAERIAQSTSITCDDVLIVDVGGGKGHDLLRFRERFPSVSGKLVCQDLPQTFSSMDLQPESIVMMEHDFFTEQPIKRK